MKTIEITKDQVEQIKREFDALQDALDSKKTQLENIGKENKKLRGLIESLMVQLGLFVPQEIGILLDTKIEDLWEFAGFEISTRAYNSLKVMKINKLNDVFGKTKRDFLTQRNCGRKTADEIFVLYKKVGIEIPD